VLEHAVVMVSMISQSQIDNTETIATFCFNFICKTIYRNYIIEFLTDLLKDKQQAFIKTRSIDKKVKQEVIHSLYRLSSKSISSANKRNVDLVWGENNSNESSEEFNDTLYSGIIHLLNVKLLLINSILY
jgi:hypothetical protein